MKSILIIITLWSLNSYGANFANVTQNDFIAATLILEAGGEKDPRAMQAVFEVIDNRVKLRRSSFHAEIFRNKQFSCWNGITAESLIDKINKTKEHKKWTRAAQIAQEKLNLGITKGATHYHTTKVNPYWVKHLKKMVVIENHVFYR